MKRMLLIICFLVFSLVQSEAQQKAFLQRSWLKTYGEQTNEEAQFILPCPDNSYLLVGSRNEFGQKRDVSLLKVDKHGNTLFEKNLQQKDDDDIYAGLVSPQDDYLLAGTSWSKGRGRGDGWIVKLSKEGEVLWERTYGHKDWESCHSILQSHDENFLITGYTSSKGEGLRDIWIFKIDTEGEMIWEKTFGGMNFDIAHSALQTTEGDYLIAGNTESFGKGGFDYWLIKTDHEGNKLWDKTFGGSKWDLSSVLLRGHEGYLLAGRTESKGKGDSDVWLLLLDEAGEIIWEHTYGTTQKDRLNSVTKTKQGYLLTITSYNEREGASDVWFLRIDKKGKILNRHTLSKLQQEEACMTLYTPEENFLMFGQMINPMSNEKDLMLLKMEVNPVIKLQDYVQSKLSSWEQRGKYEKISEYRARVNQKARELKIKAFVSEAINRYADEPFQKAISNASLNYDVEGEVFKIELPEMNSIYVQVPVHEAQDFDKNFEDIEFKRTEFSLHNGNFALSRAELYNPANDKKYVYDINQPVTYYSVEVVNQFESIEKTLTQNLWDVSEEVTVGHKKYVVGKSDVDVNIPESGLKKPRTFALIIGNEDYSSFQKSLNPENDVPFASNDAYIFSQYVQNTLGVPEQNITLLLNATAGQMKKEIDRLNKIAEASGENTELIFYYAGHGLPDERSREAYMIPVDVSGSSLKYAVKVEDLYRKLTEHPVKKATVFLDACFSGGAREAGLLAGRGIRIKPKPFHIKGNLVVFASSSGDESSGPYIEQQHGMFTYFLLKKLKETKAQITYGELAQYLGKQVKLKSLLINDSRQSPQVSYSPAVEKKWEKWTLK